MALPPPSSLISHSIIKSTVSPAPEAAGAQSQDSKPVQNVTSGYFEQRSQFQPAPPPLSTTHTVNVFEDILNQTLEELSQEQPSLAAASHAPQLQDPFDIPLETKLANLKKLETSNTGIPIDEVKIKQECRETGEQINQLFAGINSFFKRLLAQPESSLSGWMEKECKSEFFLKSRPFFNSSLLQNTLGKPTLLKPFLKSELINEWSLNYLACTALLEQKQLKAYIEGVPAEPEGGFFDSLRPLIGEGSCKALQKALIEISQGPTRQRLSETLAKMCEFDQEVIGRANNPAEIKAFIEGMRHTPEYTDVFVLRHFFFSLLITVQLTPEGLDQRDIDKWQELDLRCVRILYNSPELKDYLNEPPSAVMLNQIAMMKAQQRDLGDLKENIRLCLQMDIEPLEALLSNLEQETVNRPAIEHFLKMSKDIFINARAFEAYQWMDKDFFKLIPYNTHYRLVRLCCNKLIELKFEFPSLSLEETHAAKPVKGLAEQLKEDSAFLVQLLNQEDDQVEAWLTKHDGAAVLTRGKHFRDNIKTLRAHVNWETVRNWGVQYDACVEKLSTVELKHLLPVD